MTPDTPIIVYIIKRHLWPIVMGAICLTIVHNAIENIGGTSRWTKIAKGVINGLYASAFFSAVGGYYFNEIGLVAGILVGTLVGISGTKDFANILLDGIKSRINK